MSLKNVRKLLNETNDINEEIDDDSIQGPVIKSRKKKKAISALLLVIIIHLNNLLVNRIILITNQSIFH